MLILHYQIVIIKEVYTIRKASSHNLVTIFLMLKVYPEIHYASRFKTSGFIKNHGSYLAGLCNNLYDPIK
jgi:hypothetical protein